MARIRTVHPQLAQDRKLARVSREARYTFVLTWTICDDEGLFRAEPRQLLGQLYPFDPELEGSHLEAWLCELVDLGVLRWRHTTDGARVGEVVNWRKHQKIDRPSKSFLASELQPLDTNARACVEGGATPSMLESRVLSPESRVLSPESLGPTTTASTLFSETLAKLPVHARAALEGYYRAARYPDSLMLSVLGESPDGIHARAAVTWEILGQALADMRAGGKEFSVALLRGFIRKLLEQPLVDAIGRPLTDAEKAHALALKYEREAAAE